MLLPMPAAALIAPVDVPPDIAGQVRTFAESQELAAAAADFLVLVARIYQPADSGDLDPLDTAIAIGSCGSSTLPDPIPDRWE